jgi:hypothetical protein
MHPLHCGDCSGDYQIGLAWLGDLGIGTTEAVMVLL